MEKRERFAGKEFISNLEKYKSAIEDKSHISRRTFIWSLISLFFIFGGLTLNQESLLIKQMPFQGITETMFLIFLLIMVFCWFARLTFLYSKTYTFLKIKGIGITKLIKFIYAYSIFQLPLRKFVTTCVAKSNVEQKDYGTERHIHEQGNIAESGGPFDQQTYFRDPMSFFVEYFCIPVFIYLLALFTIILLIYRIVT